MNSGLLLSSDDTFPDLPWGDQVSKQMLDTMLAVTTWGGSSSIGLVRDNNEDLFGHLGTIFAVADGMGRLGGGSEASESTLESVFRRGPTIGIGAPLTRWRALIRMVSMDVRVKMKELGFDRAGSTLTMVAVEPERIVVAHVGDSRLYILQDSSLHQCTVDHNLGNELVANGKSIEQAKSKGLPISGLTSYIGQSDRYLRVYVDSWVLKQGTRLLLCSDGVHNYLSPDLMYKIVASLSPSEAAKQLTQEAEVAGGRDNATAIVVEI